MSQLLRDRMEELGLRYVDIARRTGISAVYISKTLRGERIPSDELLVRIADALGLEVEGVLLAAHREKTPAPYRSIFHPGATATPAPRYPELRSFFLDRLSTERRDEISQEIAREPFHLLERALSTALSGAAARDLDRLEGVPPEGAEREHLRRWLIRVEESGRALRELWGDTFLRGCWLDLLGQELQAWDYDADRDLLQAAFRGGVREEFHVGIQDAQDFRRDLVWRHVAGGTPATERARRTQRVMGRLRPPGATEARLVAPAPQEEGEGRGLEASEGVPAAPAEPFEAAKGAGWTARPHMAPTKWARLARALEEDPVLRELAETARELPPEDREELLEIARLKRGRRGPSGGGKGSPVRPQEEG